MICQYCQTPIPSKDTDCCPERELRNVITQYVEATEYMNHVHDEYGSGRKLGKAIGKVEETYSKLKEYAYGT